MSPGSKIRFQRISWSDAIVLTSKYEEWHQSVDANTSGFSTAFAMPWRHVPHVLNESKPVLTVTPAKSGRPRVVFRQVRCVISYYSLVSKCDDLVD